jgi:hypothetical protein
MAIIAVNPFILRDTLFTVAADSYEAHVSNVTFTPSSSVVPWQGLTPDASFSFGSIATWTCDLTFAQDWSTANSLSRYLFEHEGDEIAVVFEPVAGGPSVTATLIVTPGAIGGTVNEVAVATVSLGVQGRPVLEPIA